MQSKELRIDKFNVCGTIFQVSARLVKSGVSFPMALKTDKTLYNYFEITVKTEKGSIAFDFYGSANAFNEGKRHMDTDDNRHALYCLFSDACGGSESFESFCREFGYDEDSRRAERIHAACMESLSKVSTITDIDIYDLVNAMNE